MPLNFDFGKGLRSAIDAKFPQRANRRLQEQEQAGIQKSRDLNDLINRVKLAGGPGTPAGEALMMANPQMKAMRQKYGAGAFGGGALGRVPQAPEGLALTGSNVNAEGQPSYSFGPKPKQDVITSSEIQVRVDPVTGQTEQGYYDQATGNFTSLGPATEKQTKASGAVNITNQLPSEALAKGTVAKIEDSILELEQVDTTLDQMMENYEASFLTYPGQAGAGAQKVAEKVTGVPLLGKEYLGKRSAWLANAKDSFLRYRKFITGVAARPEEKADIAEAVPDPTKNSPTEFEAKVRATRQINERWKWKLRLYRQAGIPSPTEEELSRISWTEIDPQAMNAATIDRMVAKIKGMAAPGVPSVSPQQQPAAPAAEVSGVIQEALDWAAANPNDPRAKEIIKRFGAR